MGEITEGTRRHYVGVDADKDTIPASGKEKGDSYHGNDSKKQYYWNGTAWKTGLGFEYVPRAVAASDFTQVDFTIDGAWHVNGLDCSVIVPAGAVAIHFLVRIEDNLADVEFVLRANATDKVRNRVEMKTQVANIPFGFSTFLMCDADRLVDYNVEAGMNNVDVFILGYVI